MCGPAVMMVRIRQLAEPEVCPRMPMDEHQVAYVCQGAPATAAAMKWTIKRCKGAHLEESNQNKKHNLTYDTVICTRHSKNLLNTKMKIIKMKGDD